jgi:propanol-preferring alcohol dehydrogenase
MNYIGLVIKGCHVGTKKQMKELLASAARKEVIPKVEVFEFSRTGELFERIKHGDVVGRFVVRVPQ